MQNTWDIFKKFFIFKKFLKIKLKEMELTKDAYEYLLNFADDKDVLNMLSVNKKFRDEKLFEKIMKRRYPLLLKFKLPRKSYKSFFIEMIYYISKLQEEFDIPYIPVKSFNQLCKKPQIFNRYGAIICN